MRCRNCGAVEGNLQERFCWRCRRILSPVLPTPISNKLAFSSDPSRYLLQSSLRNSRDTSYSPHSLSLEEDFYFGHGDNRLSNSPIPPSPTTTNSTASPSTPDSSAHYEDFHPTFDCDDNVSRDAAFRLTYLKNHDGFEKRRFSSSPPPPLGTSNLVPYPIIHSFPGYTHPSGVNTTLIETSNSRKVSRINSPRAKTRPTLEPAYAATPERPHVCSHKCGMSFVRKYDCDRHERIHTGICPFECVCGKRFKRSDALQRHKNKSAQGLNGPDCVL